MATKKQQRRRAKLRRHEYEEVWVDEEGREVEVDEETAQSQTSSRKTDARKGSRTTRSSGGRPGRTIQPPSWRRVGKRGLIFAPLMFLTVTVLAPDSATPVNNVVQTAFLLLVFLPFSYAMDAMTYRMWRRRTERAKGDGGR
ncbi:MAG: hypothetical protein ACRDN6_12800 [Gaiellaceae bacterium]